VTSRLNRWSIAGLLIILCQSASIAATPQTVHELLPDTVVLYVSLPAPTELVDTIAEHPVYENLQALPAYQQSLQTPKYKEFLAIRGYIEQRIGMDWRKALATIADRGIHLAVDAKTEGFVLLLESSHPEQRDAVTKELVQLVREDATNKGNDDPFETGEYRGLKALKHDDAILAQLGPWLMISNKKETAQKLADTYLDGNEATLRKNPKFQRSLSREISTTAWAYVDLATLREAGVAKDLFQTQSKDFGAELIMGGIFANLVRTDHLTATLNLDDKQLHLRLETPHDPAWVAESRDFYWGPGGTGNAPTPLPSPASQLFSLQIYRDLSALWTRAGDLFGPKVVDELANADSGLSNLFGGRDFGEDILGAFRPEVQVVGVRQDFEKLENAPAVKLPGFALVLQLKDAEKMRPELRRTFQSLIGFLNIVGASNGHPQLDMEMEKQDGNDFIFARYLASDVVEPAEKAPIQYNFSPSIAFVDDRCVISSTVELARELAALIPQAQEPNELAQRNVGLALHAPALQEVLRDNRQTLVSQNQLEKGHTLEEAEAEVDMLFHLISMLRSADAQLKAADGAMTLDAAIYFADPDSPTATE
jgi:hypothetical protein